MSLKYEPSCVAGFAGDQLRPAEQPRELHPPHRALGALRPQGRRHQLRQAGAVSRPPTSAFSCCLVCEPAPFRCLVLQSWCFSLSRPRSGACFAGPGRYGRKGVAINFVKQVQSYDQLRTVCSGSEAGSYLRLIDFVYHAAKATAARASPSTSSSRLPYALTPNTVVLILPLEPFSPEGGLKYTYFIFCLFAPPSVQDDIRILRDIEQYYSTQINICI